MKRTTLFYSFLCWCLLTHSQSATTAIDSLSAATVTTADSLSPIAISTDSSHKVAPASLIKRITSSKAYEIGRIGVPLIAIGVITKGNDHNFRSMRNTYAPSFHSHYDDYLQYSPGVIMLGLKAAGVEGRSSWGRMLVSDAFSAGIMALTVNALKFTINQERPDGSSNNSFPSGHTATAFMMATMLHKEYGTTRSPLYSVLGYSLATATAISRQLNNRHWFSDVLTGAGIGIVSTELGYYLADLIFKKKGIIRSPQKWIPGLDEQPYSYIGLQMGYTIGENEIKLPQDIKMEGLAGASSALTGGWFFNRHWGATGKFTVTQMSTTVDTEHFLRKHPETEIYIDMLNTRPMTYTSILGGVEYSTRVCPGLHVGGTLMGGVGWAGNYNIDAYETGKESPFTILECKMSPIPTVDVSAYIMHMTGRNLGVKLFVNYNVGTGNTTYSYRALNAPTIESTQDKVRFQNFNIGAQVSALFWR